ncbi:hypothetical protein [Psychrobacter sp. JCM 18900]|uniref:hypothetical protein n=1 Tax=Psychrobacter sp. JCM 18900 TaxID=1298608 RepID=UPI0004B7E48C|nr:hypothetical protein [Psychrobacter sp. JCM 18900]
MSYYQTTLTLPTYARGIHIITPKVKEAISQLLPHSAKVVGSSVFAAHVSQSCDQ